MNARRELRNDPRGVLRNALEDVRAGMLGVEGSGQHMQPMTHFPDETLDIIWFVGSKSSDLVKAVGLGGQAHYCLIGRDHNLHICMSGTLEQAEDRAVLDRLWSPVLDAWFEGSRDDPDVALLRLALDEASIWASTDSAIWFATQIIKANLVASHQPDVGDHVVIPLGRLA